MDRVVDEDPRGRRARLALVVEHALERDIDRRIQVGVRQHHERVLAAQFHRRVRQVLRGAPQHLPPGRRRPGEGDALHPRVRRQGRAGGGTGNGVQDAGRQYLVGQLGQPQHRERCLLPGLDDHGVAGRQGRCALLGEMDRRPVEGQDRGDHAVGLVEHSRLDRALVDDLAVQRVGEARVIVVARRAVGQVEGRGVAARLAHLAGLQLGQFRRRSPGSSRRPAAAAGRVRAGACRATARTRAGRRPPPGPRARHRRRRRARSAVPSRAPSTANVAASPASANAPPMKAAPHFASGVTPGPAPGTGAVMIAPSAQAARRPPPGPRIGGRYSGVT